MAIDLSCKNCGQPRTIGRKLCTQCNSKRINTYPRYTWKKTCIACKEAFDAWRKKQLLCITCYALETKLRAETKNTNNYCYTVKAGVAEHRQIAQDILGRKLSYNEVIHHIDDNPKNNVLTNLLLMSRSEHGKLHRYLDLQRVIIEKSMNENQENCWNNLIVPMTTTWLETTGVNVRKLSEIGQSAAEPLRSNLD